MPTTAHDTAIDLIQVLVPEPQSSRVTDQRVRVPLPLRVHVDLEAADRRRVLRPLLEVAARRDFSLTLSPADDAFLVIRVEPVHSHAAEAYTLKVSNQEISLRSGTKRGLYYAATTLAQWLEVAAEQAESALHIAAIEIRDAPDFLHRGALIDVSRNRVPTMATLHRLVDRLSALKINQLQLYTEHTFAYQGHEEVWRNASPITPEEVRELDVYCRDRFIQLVPNQNSFGHFHRWLAHDRYRALAECPAGLAHPFSQKTEPFSLCPVDPRVFELLDDLYDQLLPQFSSRLFNAGLDETFDLGRGRSAEECSKRGQGHVYLDFLRAVYERLRARGFRMQYWADIALEHPEVIGQLPKDAIALLWGYESSHDFRSGLRLLRDASIDCYVCPGTSSWLSLGGRLDNALGNIVRAAESGLEAGALGLLITDWGDQGHLQPEPISYPAWVTAADLSWKVTGTDRVWQRDRLARRLDQFLLTAADAVCAKDLLELGNVYRRAGAQPKNASVLFRLLFSIADPLSHERYRGLDSSALRRVRYQLLDLESRFRSDSLAARELRWATRLLVVAAELGALRLTANQASRPIGSTRALAKTLSQLTAELPALWTRRSRPGGLAESMHDLHRVRNGVLALAGRGEPSS